MASTCSGRGTCSFVDAVIWVQPKCLTSKLSNQPICRSGNNAASCFPYCMAARRSGSAADGLVLYGADEWKNKVHLYERDCGYGYLENPVKSMDQQSARYQLSLPIGGGGGKLQAETITRNDVLGGSVWINSWDPAIGGCRQASKTDSFVGVEALPAYKGGVFPSIPLPGQAFAFAGDTTLTSVRKADGSYSIRVDRLYGDQSNEFTMVNVLKDFPTAPPAETLLLSAQMRGTVDKVQIPYVFNDEAGIRHPSVSTQVN